MTTVGAVVSDCRGSAAIDLPVVATELDTSAVVTTHDLAADSDRIRAALPLDALEQAVVVAGEGRERARLVADLAEAGVRTTTISPYVGDADAGRADAIVTGAANAAIATLPAREAFTTGSVPTEESVVVVGDAIAAAELADVAAVTLIADGRDISTATLPASVEVVRGQADDVEHRSDGYAVSLTRRVTDDCTGCGRCLREYPEDTTAVPVDVVTDRDLGPVCPVDAIRSASDPQRGELVADQVVWPGFDGDPSDTKWMHTDTTAIATKVRHVARIRDGPSVSVDGSNCAVGRREQDGCSACQTACPNDAITISTAGDGSVTINDDRCVGCGTCVSVCPTNAIDPVRTFGLDTFVDAVQAAVEPLEASTGSILPFSRGEPSILAFVDEGLSRQVERALTTGTVPAVVPVAVPNALHVPDVAVLYAIALGADGVLLAADPEKDRQPVRETADRAERVLEEIGLDARVMVSESRSPDDIAAALAETAPDRTVSAALDGAVTADSRVATGQAVVAGLVGEHGSGEVDVTLPGGGDVTVDSASCTLCETCGNLCPTDALTQESGRLRFDPAACVGCGLCETACPEDAIEVSATVTVDESGVGDEYVAVEKDLVSCSVCGEPFASRAGLDAIREQLDEDALGVIDLDVCPSCRQSTPSDIDVQLPR
ncbi:MAG: 4Fe-4S binding protein [Halapricum sp.]